MVQNSESGDINSWFPPTYQQPYIDNLIGQSGLTRKQAICFVRLWGYAQHQQEHPSSPIQHLRRQTESFACSHRQSAELFYYDQERGSERSAGMMIDQLVAKNLIRREPFDGGPTRLSLHIPDSFLLKSPLANDFYADSFNIRRDASLVSTFLEDGYSWFSHRSESMSFKITKALRQWSGQYPTGLRVLRQGSDDEPVGFAAFFPTHPDSEEKFHLPPSSSLYLSTSDTVDPIKVATPGEQGCYGLFIRSWQIKWQHWSYTTVCHFLEDSQATLRDIQTSFPNLCDLYTITIHPRLDPLPLALGFKPVKADPHSSIRWIYAPLDHFLDLDIEKVLVEFDFNKT